MKSLDVILISVWCSVGLLCIQHLQVTQLREVNVKRCRSVFEENSTDRLKREAPFGPPNDGQSSLVFIFDDTGSMHDDLMQLREAAKNIAREFATRENNPIYNYILVRFNDPAVRPAMETSKSQRLLEALNEIKVDGGGDCPELTMQGIINGLNAALPRSQAFVFTDASAKDYHLLNKTIEISQAKQISVSFLITGYCGSPNELKTFRLLAKHSHGIVYNLARQNVQKVVESIANDLDSGRMPILSTYWETGGIHSYPVVVDETLKKISVTVAGSNPDIAVCDSYMECNKDVESEVDLDKIKKIRMDKPTPGKWNVTTNSSSEHSVTIVGTSDIRVHYGFSFILPEEHSDTVPNPIRDIPNYLSVFIHKNKGSTFSTVELVTVTSKREISQANYTLNVLDAAGCSSNLCTYVTEPFIPPLDTFKIFVKGHDSHGNPLQYLVSTNIEATPGDELKPKVKIEKIEVRAKEGDENVQLVCNVFSAKRAVVNWIFEGEVIKDSALKRTSYRPANIYLLEFIHVKLDDVGSYFCQAKNAYGQHHEKASLHVEPLPWEIKIAESAMEVKEYETNYEIKCHTYPEGRKIKVKLLFNEQDVQNTGYIDFKVLGNTLNINVVDRHYDGNYSCVGVHNNETKISTGYLTVLYPAEIFGPLFERKIVKYEERVVLNCSAEGKPKPKIFWTREDETPSNGVIERFTPDDYGTHLCIASNGVGQDAIKRVVLETEYGKRPKVLITKKQISVDEDDQVQLVCHIISPRPLSVSWKFNDKKIKADELRNIINEKELSYLYISKAQLEDDGSYTCVVTNAYGDDKGNIKLKVKATPLNINMALKSMQTIENSLNYKIECFVSPEKRKLDLKWMLDDKILANSSEFQISGHTLIIKHIERGHIGNFTCTGEFSGETKNSSGYLNVLYPAEIIGSAEERHTVKFDDKIVLNCSASGNPEPTIIWMKENAVTTEGSSKIIDEFSPEHYGIHICQASNEIGKPAKKLVFLDSMAKESPKIDDLERDYEVKTGKNLTLKCSCKKCGPILSSTWDQVEGDRRHEIKGTKGLLEEDTKNYNYDLELVNANSVNSSVYICTIRNKYGFHYKTVNVLEVPTVLGISVNGVKKTNDDMVEVPQGKELLLSCKTAGSPKPIVHWYHNENELKASVNFMENTIKLNSFDENDIGKYTCKAFNKLGEASKHINLHVIQSNLPIPTIMITVENQSVTLPCQTQNWIFNDAPLKIEGHRYNSFGGKLMWKAAYQDSGVYKCVVNSSNSFETVLMVQVPPVIFPVEDDIVLASIGQDVILKCRSHGNPAPKITWHLNGRRLPNKHEYKRLEGKDLLVRNAQKRHGGFYMCRATNGLGIIERATNLILTAPPKITSTFTSSIQVYPYQVDSPLECRASGVPEPGVGWLKDGKPYLPEQNGVNLLYLTPLTPSGNYSCMARNVAGEDTRTVHILSQGPPIRNANYLQSKYHIDEGADLILPCPFTNIAEVDWFKDDITFPGTPGENFEIFSLPLVTRDDSGAYTCVAKNSFGTANFTQKVKVFVSESVRTDAGYDEVKKGKVGSSLEIDCKSGGDIYTSYIWAKNRRVVSMEQTLFFENLKFDDTGKYECIDGKDTGLIHQTYYVIVVGPPEAHMSQQNWITINEGQHLELECLITGIPKPQISWKKDMTAMNSTKTILPIKDIRPKDAGVYECFGVNDHGRTGIYYYYVDVLHRPKIHSLNSNITLRTEDNLILRCKAKGNPLPAVVWAFNGTRLLGSEVLPPTVSSKHDTKYLDRNGNIISKKVFNASVDVRGKVTYNKTEIIFMIIINAKRKRAGVYTCHAVNFVSTIKADINVKIMEPPTEINDEGISFVEWLVGLPLFLSCPWKTGEITKVSWEKNGKPIKRYVSHDQSFLSIPACKYADLGFYTCSARNAGGLATKTYKVNIRAPRYYDIDSMDIIAKCPLPGDESNTIVWESRSVREDNITNTLSETSTDLIVDNKFHSSIYICYHLNPTSGKKVKKLELQILKTSPLRYSEITRVANMGDNINMHCPLELNYQTLRVYWNKNEGRLLKISDVSFLKNGAILSFSNVRKMNEGIYKCQTASEDMKRGIVLKTKPVTLWSEWGPWELCTKSCGKGFRTRTRKCFSTKGRLLETSRLCSGNNIEVQTCNDFACPRNGNWSSWSDWSPCPECFDIRKSAQSEKHRKRECNSPSPFMGGKFCEGRSIEKAICETKPCPIDGNWSRWREWTECSRTCGEGMRQRIRTCDNPTPQFGGRKCTGASMQSEYCLRSACL